MRRQFRATITISVTGLYEPGDAKVADIRRSIAHDPSLCFYRNGFCRAGMYGNEEMIWTTCPTTTKVKVKVNVKK